MSPTIPVGAMAPEFAAPRQDGSLLRLSEYRGRPLILYFFPRAGTPGCTREAEGFAERYRELQASGVEVVGISTDPVERQARFAADCRVPFPLLSDADHAIARSYGVLGLLGLSKRVTFVLSADGVVIDVISGFLPGPHVRSAIDRFLTPSA